MTDVADSTILRHTWLNRMSQGFYRQGHDGLASLDHAGRLCFCPLGAACEVFLDLGGVLHVVEQYEVRFYEGERFALPERVRQAFGFRSARGDRNPPGDDVSISALNDRAKLSLPQIAAIVGKNLAAYFVD